MVKGQAGYLARLRRHVRDLEQALPTRGGMTVLTTRLLLEASGQARHNHMEEGVSGAISALKGNEGIHITDDAFEVPDGNFWQAIGGKEDGKINYDQADIVRARELFGESSEAAMKLPQTKKAKNLGGIDFSQINYDLKLDAEGVPLFDADWQHMSTNIPGLVPVIYDIAPVGVSDVFAFAQR